MTLFDRLIPKYARVPMLAALVFNCAVFWLTRPITAGMRHFDLSLWVDGRIPFVPWFIYIYILAFPQWLVGYAVICRESREVCRRVMSGEMVAKFICLVCFLLLPTCMTRPEITGSGLADRVTGLIYSLDSPDNLLPSIHCVESWTVARVGLSLKKPGRGYKIGMMVLTVLVMASVLLVKQHLFLDVVAGVAAAEIGQLAARVFRTGRIFEGRKGDSRG